MPSSTKKQAHFMSALDHGWKPSGMKHPPSRAVAHEFHEADKKEGKWEHASGGMIVQGLRRVPSGRNFNDHDLHEILGNVNGHARGGLASLPHPRMPVLEHAGPSPLESIHEGGSPLGHQMGFQHATARMPRVPISDTLRNIDAKVKGAKERLPKLKVKAGGRAKFDAGGKVGLAMNAIKTLKDALGHLANKDASSAAATLRASPAAMAHPDVAAAANGLRASTGVAPATKTLTDLVNAHTNANLVSPTFRRGGKAR